MSDSSLDWAKNATNVSVALLFGLRDRGQYGFLLPSDQIIPTAMEAMDALVEMDAATKKLGYYFLRARSRRIKSSIVIIVLGLIITYFYNIFF